MRQVVRINAEYELTKEQEKDWDALTKEQKEERINRTMEVFADDVFEDFNILELTVEMV